MHGGYIMIRVMEKKFCRPDVEMGIIGDVWGYKSK